MMMLFQSAMSRKNFNQQNTLLHKSLISPQCETYKKIM